MAQNSAKKTSNPHVGKKQTKKPSALAPKRGGNRVVAPKKAKLIAQKKLLKKHTAGLVALTEKKLGERAGHLELIGKSENKKKNGNVKK